MKKKRLLLLSCILAALIICGIFALIYILRPRDIENEIYKEKAAMPKDELLAEIIELEKDLPDMNDKVSIVPHLKALKDKAKEFTADEVLKLISDDETDVGLEMALVEIYTELGADRKEILALLEKNNIRKETKGYIVSFCGFSADELCEIFKRYGDEVGIIAIKMLCAENAEKAYGLAEEIAENGLLNASEEKQIGAFLGIAAYFENEENLQASKEKKDNLVVQIKEVLVQSSSWLVREEAVRALSRISDYELFAFLIASDEVGFYEKISVIERNIGIMIERIQAAEKDTELSVVYAAMRLHPIAEVGDELSLALAKGKIEETQELNALIEYIEENGIRGLRYEK